MLPVTVLMPVFNGGLFLKPAIESVLSQTYADFELLIINDGSTDRSESIIKSFNDSRIRYVSNSVNAGLVNTLNNGIRIARGNLLARMDADDVMLPARLEKQVGYFGMHPNIDILGCQIDIIDESGEITGERIYALEHDEIKLNSLFHCPLPHPGVMFRKDRMINNQLFYNKDQCFTEDYELWQRSFKTLKFANLNEKLLQYRVSKQQVSQVNSEQQNAETRAIRINYFKQWQVLDLSPKDHLLFLDFLDCKLIANDIEITKRLFFILEKIVAANKIHGIFNEALFNKMLARELDRLVRIYTNKANKMLTAYMAFSLFGLSTLNLQSKIKTACKQWMK